jgi:catechol 2,3-dioxygenase-like lactoylglutathione lyase family enzyme
MPVTNELSEIVLHVDDLPAQLAFYRDFLGLPVKSMPQGSPARAELNAGSCALVLDAGLTPGPSAARTRFVFRVADLNAARRDLQARGVRLGPIYEPAPDWQACDGKDPEGNLFSLQGSTNGALATTTLIIPSTNVPQSSGRRVWTV